MYFIDRSLYTDLVDKLAVSGLGGTLLIFPLMSAVVISNYEDFTLESFFSS